MHGHTAAYDSKALVTKISERCAELERVDRGLGRGQGHLGERQGGRQDGRGIDRGWLSLALFWGELLEERFLESHLEWTPDAVVNPALCGIGGHSVTAKMIQNQRGDV